MYHDTSAAIGSPRHTRPTAALTANEQGIAEQHYLDWRLVGESGRRQQASAIDTQNHDYNEENVDASHGGNQRAMAGRPGNPRT
jgi:hypothetical protein